VAIPPSSILPSKPSFTGSARATSLRVGHSAAPFSTAENLPSEAARSLQAMLQALFPFATVIASRYHNHRWVPWLAYGFATAVSLP